MEPTYAGSEQAFLTFLSLAAGAPYFILSGRLLVKTVPCPSMLLYNVTVKVSRSIEKEWLEWLREEHLPDMMATGKFTHHRLCKLLLDEPDGVTYAVQYFCPDFSTYQRYQEENAPALREEAIKRFGDKQVSFRTLMELL